MVMILTAETTLSTTTDIALAIDGADPIRTETWPTYEGGDVWISRHDEDAAIRAIRDQLYFRYDDRPIEETNTGQFEQRLCEYFGVDNALACASGTAAITLCLLGLELAPGTRIACPAFTFAATPSAIILAGCQPVLVDCDEDLHMDLDSLRRALDDGCEAVVVVHMRGFASDIEAICAMAAAYGVPVVEDAVPALGARVNGQLLGTFGDFGAFSTQSDKSLNTGEGGFLISNNDAAFARSVVFSGAYEGRAARHFPDGCPPMDQLAYPIFSLRMDEIRAALANALLLRLPDRLAAHRRVYDRVATGLSGVPGIALRRPVADGAYLGEALVFRLPGAAAEDAAWFAEALCAEGISARGLGDPGKPNVRAFWNWRFLVGSDADAAKALCPSAAKYVCEAVDVPLSANLTREDCDQLIQAVDQIAHSQLNR